MAAIVVMMGLNLLARVGEFLWNMKKEKDDHTLSELRKAKLDLRRLFTAIKILAGDRWDEIREQIMKDEKWNDDKSREL